MKLAHRFTAFLGAVMLVVFAGCAPTPTRQGAGEYLDDTVITSKVKAALARDPEVKATEVQVDTFKGRVQLSGFVSSRESAKRAVELAQQVQGVKEVKDNTTVK